MSNEKTRTLTCDRLALLLSLCLSLGACGGGGSGGGGTAPSKVFVADSGNSVIGSVANPNPAPGIVRIDRIISSPQLTGTIPALFLDVARNELYVSNETSLVVFARANIASGSTNISRRIATLVPPGGNFNSLYLDTVRNMLYVGDQPNGVRVYHGARTANELGGPDNLPDRTLSGDFGANFVVRDVAVDTTKDILYVAVVNNGPLAMSVMSFDNASTLNGTVAPSRTITISTSVYGTMGLFIDAGRDRLYVADTANGVHVYDTASIKSDPVIPDRSIGLPSVVNRLAVDTVNDRLYATAGTAVYIVPNVSTASGVIPAIAALAGAGSSFTAVAVAP